MRNRGIIVAEEGGSNVLVSAVNLPEESRLTQTKVVRSYEISKQGSFQSFILFGIEIGGWPPNSQYLFCTGGVMLFLLLYGYLQELVVMNKFKRSFGWFVTLLQLSGYAFCATLQDKLIGNKTERRIPIYYYLVLSILQVVMQGLTNISMYYLNYPAKTLFKSSRVIMTMLFGLIFFRKKYKANDYLIAVAMVIGLTTFVAADANSSPEFDYRGVVLILLALAADASIINVQEHCMTVFNAGHEELVYFSNLGAAAVAFLLSLLSGELSKGLSFLAVIGSFHVFFLFMMFSAAGFLGVTCLAALTKKFGALTSALTSVVRKGLTLIISYVMFPDHKSFTPMHLLGASIFLGSLLTKSFKHGSKQKNLHKDELLNNALLLSNGIISVDAASVYEEDVSSSSSVNTNSQSCSDKIESIATEGHDLEQGELDCKRSPNELSQNSDSLFVKRL